MDTETRLLGSVGIVTSAQAPMSDATAVNCQLRLFTRQGKASPHTLWDSILRRIDS